MRNGQDYDEIGKKIMVEKFRESVDCKIDFGGSSKHHLIWVPPSETTIGSPEGEVNREPEEQQFRVTFESGYWLGSHLITIGQWNSIMPEVDAGLANLPVTKVSWNDVIQFCEVLNSSYAEVLPVGYSFSLPTEAQWEHACRAGSTTRYCSGDSVEDLERVGWVESNSGGSVQEVGKKMPNQWGFYDMHGNVAEWCFDSFGDYPTGDLVEYVNTVSTDEVLLKVARSANAKHSIDGAFRSAARSYGFADSGNRFTGFRIAVRKIANISQTLSPAITEIQWGMVDIEGFGRVKDAKLFPGGAREWNWKETNTRHVPGIQIADVEELLQHGSRIIILSKGMELALRTAPETIAYLKNKRVVTYAEESNDAVELYNTLARRGEPVGALIHSTC